jgi:hypothetical protein
MILIHSIKHHTIRFKCLVEVILITMCIGDLDTKLE